MGKLLITLTDDVEKAFREKVKKVYGARRGAISIVIEQLVKEWIKGESREG